MEELVYFPEGVVGAAVEAGVGAGVRAAVVVDRVGEVFMSYC